jgi:tRNA A-37 threonylcarbamoyl transferase component Bud32
MEDVLTVNGSEYRVIRLLGKGKGGYSYLVTDGERTCVLKQIHHEPCDYYSFGNKLESELRDYETLKRLGITMPRLLAVDPAQERILKEYIEGEPASDLIHAGKLDENWLEQLRAMCDVLYPAGLNIDYYPANFVPCRGVLYYVDYECNPYMEQWDLEHWGLQYWTSGE